MVTDPALSPRTSPFPSTVATDVAVDAHVKVTAGTGVPDAVEAVALSRTVSPASSAVTDDATATTATTSCGLVVSAHESPDIALTKQLRAR